MKCSLKYIAVFVLVLSGAVAFAKKGKSDALPSAKTTLKAMQLANKYFMDKWPDPSTPIVSDVKKKTWPSNIWTRAVYYEGLMALYAVDNKKPYLDYAINWSDAHQWSFNKGIETRNADNQCAGQTYFDLFMLKQDSGRIKDTKASIDLMLASDKSDDWSWIDAIQMAMPVFANLGVYYKDTAYFNKMWDLYSFAKYRHGSTGLYNSMQHLWWRDKDFVPPCKTPNGKNCYWSRGNGWVVAALVRVLTVLPKTDAHYAEYMQDYKDMMMALLPLQRPDGYWNPSLDDDTDYAGKESTGTSLFVYGMAWGIQHHYLDKDVFMPAMTKAWNVLLSQSLHSNGFLGFVQGTGKEPKDGQPVTYDHIPDFEDYGLGCFLLAGSEVYKLSK